MDECDCGVEKVVSLGANAPTILDVRAYISCRLQLSLTLWTYGLIATIV